MPGSQDCTRCAAGTESPKSAEVGFLKRWGTGQAFQGPGPRCTRPRGSSPVSALAPGRTVFPCQRRAALRVEEAPSLRGLRRRARGSSARLRPFGSACTSPAAQGLSSQTRGRCGHTVGSRDPVSARTCPGARRVCSQALTSSHTGALRSPGKVAPVRALCGERSAAARAGAPEPLPQGPLRGRPKSPGRQPPSAALPPPRQPDYSSQDASGGGAAPPGTLRARGGTGPARAGGGAAGAREVRISARRPQHERGPRTSP